MLENNTSQKTYFGEAARLGKAILSNSIPGLVCFARICLGPPLPNFTLESASIPSISELGFEGNFFSITLSGA